uniref:Uncharacterized protein n=1 Tax=Romanomermis culicivorax TaxID=13658 RepID=A0A915KBY7_ROMCU
MNNHRKLESVVVAAPSLRPKKLEFRNCCGSPTDSGYRSVPRAIDQEEGDDSESKNNFVNNIKSPNSRKMTTDNNLEEERMIVSTPVTTKRPPPTTTVLIDSSPGSAQLRRKSSRCRNNSIYEHSCHTAKSPASSETKNFSTTTTDVMSEGFATISYPKLVQLDHDKRPWNEKDLRSRNVKKFVDQIAVNVLPYLDHFLQRPLIRLAKEMRRLSSYYDRCTKVAVRRMKLWQRR